MFFQRLTRTPFWTKLTNWEYWPFGILQAPLFLYWLWLAVRERSLLYFSASNPGILTGGMMGESKYEVLQLVPARVKPVTLLIKVPTNASDVEVAARQGGLSYPMIAKPDMGERGWMVRKLKNEADLKQYLSEINTDFLLQQFVDEPLEFGIFYRRYPSEKNGRVTSITGKEFLHVVGNGVATLQQLMEENNRARLRWPELARAYTHRLHEVLPAGEKLELVSIGNHCLGTKFLNANHLISDRLNQSFDALSQQIGGFYFGRYDVRCASLQDLEAANVMVLELNGCGAEPAHIYQPGFSFREALRVLWRHWRDMHRVSRENHERGVPYLPLAAGWRIYKQFKRVTTRL